MKRIQRVLALVCAAVMLPLLLTGCGGDKYEKLKTPGVLLVGTEIGYPPFEFYADDGVTPLGMDIALAKEIADILGLEVQYQNTDFEGILDGLAIQKYDAVLSAVTITAARQKKVIFSTPYIENWQAIVVRKGDAPLTDPKQLSGKKVAYQKATTSTEYLDKLRETGVVTDCQVSEYEKVMSCFDDLRFGRVDAVLCDSVVAEGYLAREPESFEISWHQKNEQGASPELFGVAVRKGNTALLDEINEALRQLEESGKLDELRQTWLS